MQRARIECHRLKRMESRAKTMATVQMEGEAIPVRR